MKMIRFILLLLALYTVQSVLATSEDVKIQAKKTRDVCGDTIYLEDGRIIPVAFISDDGIMVKYKKCDDFLNRVWKKEKSKVIKVVLSNGSIKDYSEYRGTLSQKEIVGRRVGLLGMILIGLFCVLMLSLFTTLYAIFG